MALGAVLTALGAFHYIDKGYAVREATKATEARLNASYAVALNTAAIKAKAIEDALSLDAQVRLKDKDAKINAISVSLRAANDRLRTRANRPTDYTPPTTVTTACSGRELYREDGEFLNGEAATAEAVLVERDYYYNQYEAARKKLDEFAK